MNCPKCKKEIRPKIYNKREEFLLCGGFECEGCGYKMVKTIFQWIEMYLYERNLNENRPTK